MVLDYYAATRTSTSTMYVCTMYYDDSTIIRHMSIIVLAVPLVLYDIASSTISSRVVS